ncbi:MAG: hypothetical protein K0Q95_2157 [Bacteroidota bacterium]|jgi:hypothetical protein|nr:hypothetical protein [Bacteroidota bacterium]
MDSFDFIMNFQKLNSERLTNCKIIVLTSSIHNGNRIKAGKMDKSIVFFNKPLTNEILIEM